jgi:MFS family permease
MASAKSSSRIDLSCRSRKAEPVFGILLMPTTRTSLFTPVLIAGCIIMMISFAIRASFGVFQIPIAEEFGWLRAEFSLAIAIQNLAWGIGQPIFGAIAERFGDRRAIVAGALTYAAGLVLSSFAVTPGAHQLLEILVGFGIAGTGFGVILAVVGRAAADEHRSLALGVATAAGSAGQVIGAPVAEWLLTMYSWQTVFVIFAATILATLLSLPLMRVPRPRKAGAGRADNHDPGPATGVSRPLVHADLPWLFLLRLSARLHHRAFPGLRHRDVQRHRPDRHAGLAGRDHHIGAGGGGDRADRAGQYRRHPGAAWLGKRYSKKYLLASIYAAAPWWRRPSSCRRSRPSR